MEVIERDAWSIFESNKKPKPEIDLSKTENSLIKNLSSKFSESGVNVRIFNIIADINISTMVAVADDTILKDPALLTIGVGTHLDPEIAVIRALTEVAQSRATQIHGTREDTDRAMVMRKIGYERMKRLNKYYFTESEETTDLSAIENRSTSSFKTDLEISLHELTKFGFEEVFYVDITRPEINIPVVRVIIPGLEVSAVDPERIGKRVSRKVS
jgi:ribosomal protein S12 methylthiotransferase accessory factor